MGTACGGRVVVFTEFMGNRLPISHALRASSPDKGSRYWFEIKPCVYYPSALLCKAPPITMEGIKRLGWRELNSDSLTLALFG